jgi:D-glycero-D-manno-heptose 1,7-bisphosphate phosphatase
MKVAFLDRDGTITADHPDDQWGGVSEPVFLDGTFEALHLFRSKGFEIVVITNQYLIGERYITWQQYHDYAEKIIARCSAEGIDILDVFYCPHARDAGCSCSKPKPGMIEAACGKYPDIEMEKSFYVGDWDVDILLANAVGLKAYGIGFENEKLQYTKVDSLLDVASGI